MSRQRPQCRKSGGRTVANSIVRFKTVERVVREELAKPYAFGSADCWALGCRVADALDPKLGMSEKYLGGYDTWQGAQKALRAQGYRTLDAFLASLLAPCAPAAARHGDLAVVQVGRAQHVAVCVGTRFISKEEKGRLHFEVSDCIAAFRTGD